MKNVDDALKFIVEAVPGLSVVPRSYKKTAPVDGRDCYEVTFQFNGQQLPVKGHIDRLRSVEKTDDQIIQDIRQWTLKQG